MVILDDIVYGRPLSYPSFNAGEKVIFNDFTFPFWRIRKIILIFFRKKDHTKTLLFYSKEFNGDLNAVEAWHE